MAYRYFGDIRMELDWFVAYIEFESLGLFIDYSGGLEREREDYLVHQYSCLGEYLGAINIMTWSKEKVPCGGLIDTRTLLLLKAKCCPLAMGGAILEGLE